jgi:hypothetical protein
MITGARPVAAAQAAMAATLRSALEPIGERALTSRAGAYPHKLHGLGEGRLYFATKREADSGTERFWNAFGFLDQHARTQEIVVEINVPVAGRDNRVAGFFAEDEHGRVLIMHSGKVGGGRSGIGRDAFLRSISDKPSVVRHSEGDRFGLAIGYIADPNLPRLVERFAERVRRFKAAAAGRPAPADTDGGDRIDVFTPESSGRRRSLSRGPVDYWTYHGMVVDALRDDRMSRSSRSETVANTDLIDLLVSRAGRMTELYEVKTRLDRQSFYTALGQLMTHGVGDEPQRVMVLPADGDLPEDCRRALSAHRVELRRFRIVGEGGSASVDLIS